MAKLRIAFISYRFDFIRTENAVVIDEFWYYNTNPHQIKLRNLTPSVRSHNGPEPVPISVISHRGSRFLGNASCKQHQKNQGLLGLDQTHWSGCCSLVSCFMAMCMASVHYDPLASWICQSIKFSLCAHEQFLMNLVLLKRAMKLVFFTCKLAIATYHFYLNPELPSVFIWLEGCKDTSHYQFHLPSSKIIFFSVSSTVLEKNTFQINLYFLIHTGNAPHRLPKYKLY